MHIDICVCVYVYVSAASNILESIDLPTSSMYENIRRVRRPDLCIMQHWGTLTDLENQLT